MKEIKNIFKEALTCQGKGKHSRKKRSIKPKFQELSSGKQWVQLLGHVRLFLTLWTVACRTLLSMGFFKKRILEYVAIFLLQGIFPTQGVNPESSSPVSPELQADSLPEAAAAKSLQSCPTLHDPIDGSPPGSPVPGILQARILEYITC